MQESVLATEALPESACQTFPCKGPWGPSWEEVVGGEPVRPPESDCDSHCRQENGPGGAGNGRTIWFPRELVLIRVQP